MTIPDSIKPFVDEFSKLPGLGPRQVIRLAYYLANKKQVAANIAEALQIIQGLKVCPLCFLAHNNKDELCGICGDSRRNQNIIAIVEKETDLISIEAVKKYHGVYLCLGDIKKAGKLDETQKIKLDALKARGAAFAENQFEEIIIAFSPTTAGDISAEIIMEYLRPASKKITRLGRGIPIGGEVEFTDVDTLQEALESRK